MTLHTPAREPFPVAAVPLLTFFTSCEFLPPCTLLTILEQFCTSELAYFSVSSVDLAYSSLHFMNEISLLHTIQRVLASNDIIQQSSYQTTPAATMYKQSFRSTSSLLKGSLKNRDSNQNIDHKRSTPQLRRSVVRFAEPDRSVSTPPVLTRPEARHASETDLLTPRITHYRRRSWLGETIKEEVEPGPFQHHEGPLRPMTSTCQYDLPRPLHRTVQIECGHQEGSQSTTQEGTILPLPTLTPRATTKPSRAKPPFTIRASHQLYYLHGYTGLLPRFYQLTNELTTIPSPSTDAEVDFLRAQLAQMRLDLVAKDVALVDAEVVKKEAVKKAVARERVKFKREVEGLVRENEELWRVVKGQGGVAELQGQVDWEGRTPEEEEADRWWYF